MHILVYDDTEKSWLRWTWVFGARLWRRKWTLVIPARSWGQVIDELTRALRPGTIDTITFWGHGRPGAAVIDGVRLHPRDAGMLAPLMAPRSYVWLRACNVCATSDGQRYQADLARSIGARVVAHTHIVWLWHGATYTLVPGASATWPVTTGVDADGKKRWCWPWTPRTVSMLTHRVPAKYL
jgi:hypothetical protein